MDNQEQVPATKIHLTYEGDKLTVDIQGNLKSLTLLLALAMKHSGDLKNLTEMALLAHAQVEKEMSANEPPQG